MLSVCPGLEMIVMVMTTKSIIVTLQMIVTTNAADDNAVGARGCGENIHRDDDDGDDVNHCGTVRSFLRP